MPLIELPIKPGIVKDNSELLSEGRWIDGDHMRFRNVGGKPQAEVTGGYSALFSDTFSGTARGAHAWASQTGIDVLAFGTNTKCYAISEDFLWDITPLRLRGYKTDAASTQAGSATITITHTEHGVVTGDTVYLYAADVISGLRVGLDFPGVTGNLNTTANSRIISVTETAHGMSDGDRLIIEGAVDVGGVGGDAISQVVPMPPPYNIVHTLNVTGANTFSFATGTVATSTDSQGAGNYKGLIAYTATKVDANNYTIQAKSGTATSTVALSGGLFLYEYEYSPGSATSTVTDLVRIWFWSNFGDVGIANHRNSILYQWSNVPSERMTAVAATDAPQENLAHMVTPERFLMALGTEDATTSTFDPMRVAWAKIEGGLTTNDWTPASTNSAGSFRIAEGSKIINGIAMPFVSLVWTDTALYQLQYIESLDVVYRPNLVGTGCGLIGPHAFARAGDSGQVYWLSPTQEFMMWQGGAPITIQCPVRDWFFTNLASGGEEFIHACVNEKFNEVVWYFPDAADSDVVRYAALNYSELHWTIGTLPVSAMQARGVFDYPIGLHLDGTVHEHEKGLTANGSSLAAYVKSGYMDMGEGENLLMFRRFAPNMSNLTGNVQVTVYSKNWQSQTETGLVIGSFDSTTEKIDFRVTARYVAVRFDFTSTSSSGRFGKILFDVMPVGSRR